MANSNYHALQLNLRKRMQNGVQFDFNYTFSKSIDLASDAERIGFVGGLGGQIINSWDPKALRAVSDFDTTHQFNANWIVELPFGRGETDRPRSRQSGGRGYWRLATFRTVPFDLWFSVERLQWRRSGQQLGTGRRRAMPVAGPVSTKKTSFPTGR